VWNSSLIGSVCDESDGTTVPISLAEAKQLDRSGVFSVASGSLRSVRGSGLLPVLVWDRESLSHGEDAKGIALFLPLLHQPDDRLLEVLMGLS
jgi:hypothetical protein